MTKLINTLLLLLTWWNGQTIGTRFFTSRHGQKVGEDAEGNVFYRTADDKHRWVIFNGESEASRISPDWHGWLHRTYDQPPSEAPLTHRDWEKPHHENQTGSAEAYLPPGSIRRAAPAPRADYEAWVPE